MRWWVVLLLFALAVVYGFARGFASAWWRDRHPMELTLTRTEKDGEPPHVVLTSPRPVTHREHETLRKAAESAAILSVRLPQSWRLGDGPLPEHGRER